MAAALPPNSCVPYCWEPRCLYQYTHTPCGQGSHAPRYVFPRSSRGPQGPQPPLHPDQQQVPWAGRRTRSPTPDPATAPGLLPQPLRAPQRSAPTADPAPPAAGPLTHPAPYPAPRRDAPKLRGSAAHLATRALATASARPGAPRGAAAAPRRPPPAAIATASRS